VEPAEMTDRILDRTRDAVGLGDIGLDRDRPVAGEMRTLLARHAVELGDRHPGALAGEQNSGGAPDPGASTGDQHDLAVKPPHANSPNSSYQPGKAPHPGPLSASGERECEGIVRTWSCDLLSYGFSCVPPPAGIVILMTGRAANTGRAPDAGTRWQA